MKEYELIFNNKMSTELDLYVSEYPSIPMLTEETDTESVEGRSGDLIIKKGTYKDRDISINFKLLNQENYWEKLDLIYDWLTNVESDQLIYDRQDRCFRVKNITFGDLDRELRLYGKFNIKFTVEPFLEDLTETMINISSNQFRVHCGGNIGAETLFRVNGQGDIQLTVNGETMHIENATNYVEIDSRLLQVRNQDGTSKDNDTLGNFSRFVPGNNDISYVGNITNIELVFTNLYR